MDHDTAELIDGLLDRHRPDRYGAGEDQWRNPVYAAVESRVTIAQARTIAAKALVDQREGQATRSTNALLREIGRTKQWPLGWLDVARRPVSVLNQRVCLIVATADEFQAWEVDERRRAATDFTARNQACDGAQWLAEQMADGGWGTFGEAAASHLGEAS